MIIFVNTLGGVFLSEPLTPPLPTMIPLSRHSVSGTRCLIPPRDDVVYRAREVEDDAIRVLDSQNRA